MKDNAQPTPPHGVPPAYGHACPICSSADMTFGRVKHLANQFRELHNKTHKPETAQHAADAAIIFDALMCKIIDAGDTKFAAAQLALITGDAERALAAKKGQPNE